MAAETRVIVGIGEVLWDMLPAGKALGGAPANFIYHAAEIGGEEVQPLLVSCVGNDPLGREILERWDQFGLSGEFISVDALHPTGAVTVTVDPHGEPVYAIGEHAAWDFLPQTPQLRELAATADAVCFGTLAQRAPASRKAIQDFLRQVGQDALRILDLNLRAPFISRAVTEESLSLANVLKINDEELRALAEMFSITGGEDAVAEGLMRRYPLRWIVLTKGEGGSVLHSPRRKFVHRGYSGLVADSVGAGDAFAAAIAVGMLRGAAPEEINERANRLASFVCTRAGAMPPVPDELKIIFR
jgi:fructokinase